MHRIIVFSYAQTNLGDDLFVYLLCKRFQSTRFLLPCPRSHRRAFRNLTNLTLLPHFRYIDRLFRKLGSKTGGNHLIYTMIARWCDAVCYVSGSMFMQGPHWKEQLQQKESFAALGKPNYYIGCNFGPYTDANFLASYHRLFASVSDVCFRDKYSYSLFMDLPNIRCAADVIFSYPVDETADVEKASRLLVSAIDLSTRNVSVLQRESYEQSLADICSTFMSHNYEVVLMSFCAVEGDCKAIEAIRKRIGMKNSELLHLYAYEGDVKEAILQIRSASCIVASRFHAVVLGLLNSKPVLPVIYSDKTKHMLDGLGYEGKSVRISEMVGLDPDDVFDYLIHSTPIDVSSAVLSAKEQFAALASFIGGT